MRDTAGWTVGSVRPTTSSTAGGSPTNPGDVTITITNVNDPTTYITMNGDYTITAKFLIPKQETLATANNQSLDLTLLPGH